MVGRLPGLLVRILCRHCGTIAEHPLAAGYRRLGHAGVVPITVVDHPVVAERLTCLRDRTTKRAEFRRNLHELSRFLLYEALRDQAAVAVDIDTPMGPAHGVQIADPPIIVPILRAGLGMLDAALELLPNARVAFVGARRNEQTLLPDAYLNTIPDDLGGRRALVIDPMLATGGSLAHTCALLEQANVGHITVVCVLAAPEGVAATEALGRDLTIFTAAVDRGLNDVAFIVPGLGDAGDRQFGLA